ncbi:MAG TPA: transferrin receptor-like dimerization domain-containing protein [Bryobacteraceae bacterium]|nr:transferrin receptor-like dimerization domain-containing protein [Bryobacteraceae bacterium]
MFRLPLLAVLAAGASLIAADATLALRGYSADDTHAEQSWEEKFRALPSPANMREYMRLLSARPHHVGSPYDEHNAQWILARFREWGLDAHIETFQVLFPTPKSRLVELVEPRHFTAKLREPAVPVDPTSDQTAEQLPTYNAYSIDGDVTAPLVYVNFGVPEDYEQLDRLGVSVKGAIVIARYGNSWRGIKPKVAAEHGAVACIIYSDPQQDGYRPGVVFPEGAWRPPDGVQRGSVMDMPTYPGDPLTPGIGATANAKRLKVAEATTLTKIPVLPISYSDAQPLLEALQGPLAPDGWSGGLPITYHVGPGPAKVHLALKFNWDLKPVNDVIAIIPGGEYKDEWIVRGNHHDAWVNGAEDPISGQMVLLEEARALGELRKQGWTPKRTIVYAAWDGEEEGLLGSTEWAEAHADDLMRHAAVYINSDGNGRGYLQMAGSHTLEDFVNQVARQVEDPETKLSAWKRLQQRRISRADKTEDRNELRTRADLRMGALGSGSDYTAFIDHLGIASLDLAYFGEDGGGIYHSIYDDFYWYTHFSDTDFVYGRALAQTVGTAVMRLADADVLPFQFTDFADTIHKSVDEVKRLWKEKHDEIEERNRELDEGLFAAIRDPHKTLIPPPHESIPAYLNFAPLETASDMLTRSAQAYEKALADAKNPPAAQLNAQLIRSERVLTDDAGLPRRPWFRHQIYAPGYYTGYEVKTLPGVREAIEEKHWDEADKEIQIVARVLRNEAALLDDMTGLLKAR